jgi:hypothetical protein
MLLPKRAPSKRLKNVSASANLLIVSGEVAGTVYSLYFWSVSLYPTPIV